MHVGAIPTLHARFGRGGGVDVVGLPAFAFVGGAAARARRVARRACEEPSTGVPAMFPEASSWRTSLAVIGHGEPSTRVQSRRRRAWRGARSGSARTARAPHAFSAAL